MKMNKILAVLLSVAMVVALIPAFTLTTSAAVGAITNGGFETGDFTGWDYNEWAHADGTVYSGSGLFAVSPRSGDYCVKMNCNNTIYGAVALEQIVPVNTNATYELTFYARRSGSGSNYTCVVTLGTSATSFASTNVHSSAINAGSSSYSSNTVTFNTGTYKYARIRFVTPSSGSRTNYVDDIAMTATKPGDTGTHAKPSLTAFATEYNWPKNSNNTSASPSAVDGINVIKEPGFESTTNAQWNDANFLTNGVSRVTGDAAGARSGSSYLKYYRGSTAPSTWSQFSVNMPGEGTYVFSAWVRTPYLSADNQGKASIGIMDTDTGKFLTYGSAGGSYDGHYSNKETQIRSTATDNRWHLRSVVFYVGGAATIQIGIYGLKSTMYIDDISIHSLDNGVKYQGNQTGTIPTPSTSVSKKYCESEDNLIPDCNMNSSASKDFWSSASGWNVGMMEIAKDPQNAARGNTLHYQGTNTGSNKLYNYIKFIPVEPDTNYTVTFDYRVASAGNQLMFIDNDIESPKIFYTPNLNAASNNWNTATFTFNSGNYARIGIVLRNHATAELYLDDIFVFKNNAASATNVKPEEEVIATLKPEGGETSRMETEYGYGVAFKFSLQSIGAKYVENPDREAGQTPYTGDLSAAQVNALQDGNLLKLVKMGAVMTNDESVGVSESLFTLSSVNNGKTVINIDAEKLYGISDEKVLYAVRIINIPEKHKGSMIYARPYYVFEYEGKQFTVYGEIYNDTAVGVPDINDGWLEWD